MCVPAFRRAERARSTRIDLRRPGASPVKPAEAGLHSCKVVLQSRLKPIAAKPTCRSRPRTSRRRAPSVSKRARVTRADASGDPAGGASARATKKSFTQSAQRSKARKEADPQMKDALVDLTKRDLGKIFADAIRSREKTGRNPSLALRGLQSRLKPGLHSASSRCSLLRAYRSSSTTSFLDGFGGSTASRGCAATAIGSEAS